MRLCDVILGLWVACVLRKVKAWFKSDSPDAAIDDELSEHLEPPLPSLESVDPATVANSASIPPESRRKHKLHTMKTLTKPPNYIVNV